MLATLAQSLRSDLNHLIVVHLEKVMGPIIDEASIINPSLPHITNHFDYGESRVEHDFSHMPRYLAHILWFDDL